MSASLVIKNTSQNLAFTAAATGPVTFISLAQTGTNSTGFAKLKIGESYNAELVITSSTGTVDGVLQHSTDGGVTWRNLPLKFAQIAAVTAPNSQYASLVFKPAVGLSDPAFAPTLAATGAAIAANVPFQTDYVRLFLTLGTAGATTGNLVFTASPKGVVAQ